MKPWMHDREIDMVLKYISDGKDKVMLEWGSGGSTSLFSKHVKTYNSIEHNLDWYYEVRQDLVNNKIENVTQFLNDYPKGRAEVYDAFYDKWESLILQVSEEPTNNYHGITNYPSPKEMYVWYQYVNAIDNFPEKKYDFIFIDGRSRINCAYKALDYIDENSIIFIHDFFNRPFYNPIFEHYEEIDSVKDTEQTIVVLKKKV
jgi:hypothetical protein